MRWPVGEMRWWWEVMRYCSQGCAWCYKVIDALVSGGAVSGQCKLSASTRAGTHRYVRHTCAAKPPANNDILPAGPFFVVG